MVACRQDSSDRKVKTLFKVVILGDHKVKVHQIKTLMIRVVIPGPHRVWVAVEGPLRRVATTDLRLIDKVETKVVLIQIL